jgi:hypothetical protein
MTINNKNKLLLSVLALVAAYSVGRFSSPKRVEIEEREKIIYRDRIIQDDKHHTRTEIRETLLPDGTKIVETITDNKRETVTDSRREMEKEEYQKSVSINQSDWSVGLYTTTKKSILMTIDRRILGGLFLGVYGRSEMPIRYPLEVGVGLRLEF